MVFSNNRKNLCLPPFPVDELFEELSGKNFLGHLKKNIVQRNVAGKKILASNWGMKKNSCTEKLPNLPLKYLMVRPLGSSMLPTVMLSHHRLIRGFKKVRFILLIRDDGRRSNEPSAVFRAPFYFSH
jgi:hypothetical protein